MSTYKLPGPWGVYYDPMHDKLGLFRRGVCGEIPWHFIGGGYILTYSGMEYSPKEYGFKFICWLEE